MEINKNYNESNLETMTESIEILKTVFGVTDIKTRKLASVYLKRSFVGYYNAFGVHPEAIGKHIGIKRSTVYHHIKNFKNECDHNKYFKKKYDEFIAKKIK